MRIVINADDFGMCDDTVRATIECFEKGGLSSATIMPTMPATAAAMAFARDNPQFSFGAHLTFIADTTEHPLSDVGKIPALVTAAGIFPPSNVVRKRALFNQLPVDQIAIELEAQLGFFRDQGIALSHVDSHGHLHKFGPFRAALRTVLPRFGITRVRSVQDVYFKKPLKSPTFWLGPWWRGRLRKNFKTTDHFYMPTSAFETDWQERLVERFREAGERSIEVGVHPGFQEPWRDAERLGTQRLGQLARKAGYGVIGWKDV